jgi:hypothetical protein
METDKTISPEVGKEPLYRSRIATINKTMPTKNSALFSIGSALVLKTSS